MYQKLFFKKLRVGNEKEQLLNKLTMAQGGRESYEEKVFGMRKEF